MWSAKTPEIIKPLAGDMVWEIHPVTSEVFLTFDDGPTPGVTDLVLDMLRIAKAKATFFCLGKNVLLHPELYAQIKAEGHATGNHTVNHCNGWKTDNRTYFREFLSGATATDRRLFRPPYGRITRQQASLISKKSHIVMWDVLSGDFDPKTSVEACIKHVLDNARAGSVIVMHDSVKAAPTMLGALPRILEGLKKEGLEPVALESKFLEHKKRA